MTFTEWEQRHPEAAADLARCFLPTAPPPAPEKSEAWAQQQVRLQAARVGAFAWRNNVGATPARCGDCGAAQRPIRYGLANDSAQLNARLKSSDLILAIPRQITRADVGTTLAQFGAVECKAPGWGYTATERERAQLAWLTLIRRLGGMATFSTGVLEL